MKTTTHPVMLIITLLAGSIFAQEAPKENLQPPTRTQFFSGKTQRYASALEELLATGSGKVELQVKIPFTRPDEQGGTTTSWHDSFDYSKGVIAPNEPKAPHSGSKISVTADGWLIIQRGKQVQMIPVTSLKVVTGEIPNRIEHR